MPRCAQVLLGALTLLLHQTVGLAAVVDTVFAVTAWAASTPAVLVAVAALAAWHLAYQHPPRTTRART